MSEMLSKSDAVAKLRTLVFGLSYVIAGNVCVDKSSTRETQYCFSKYEYQL
jgi:hypothetical protein